MEDLKAKFSKIYANLPLGVREEIVIVIDSEPLSWKATNLEVEQGTKKGKEILEQLSKLKILL